MTFPDKAQRKLCWDSRDTYWQCIEKHNAKDSSERPKECNQLRTLFETSCPSQWVTHFDRKWDYNTFKEKMNNKGYDPVQEQK